MFQDTGLRTYAAQVIRPFIQEVGLVLDKGPEVQRILFSVEHVHVHEFVLFMLDVMIRRKTWRGILVSVDRPFNYITKLLTHREVNLDRLTVIDIMTALVSDTPKVPDNVIVLRSPFCDGLHKDLVGHLAGTEAGQHGIDLSKNHFLMFDNIAVLDHYIEMMHIKKLFVKLEEVLKGYPMLKHILIIDKGKQGKVYQAFKGWADEEVALPRFE
jgi:hypothetical protein